MDARCKTSMFARVMFLAAALTTAACADPGETTVAFSFTARPPLKAEMLHATVRMGGRTWQIEGKDMTPEAMGFGNAGPVLPVLDNPLTFSFVLTGSAGDTISSGSMDIMVRTGTWYVDVFGPATDAHSCIECIQGVQPFSLSPAYRTTDRDEVWVVWGGEEH